jgi:hypothetical protein
MQTPSIVTRTRDNIYRPNSYIDFLFYDSGNGGSIFLRIACKLLFIYTASHLSRWYCNIYLVLEQFLTVMTIRHDLDVRLFQFTTVSVNSTAPFTPCIHKLASRRFVSPHSNASCRFQAHDHKLNCHLPQTYTTRGPHTPLSRWRHSLTSLQDFGQTWSPSFQNHLE